MIIHFIKLLQEACRNRWEYPVKEIVHQFRSLRPPIYYHFLSGPLHPSRFCQRMLQRVQVLICFHFLPVPADLRPAEVRFSFRVPEVIHLMPRSLKKATIRGWYSLLQLLATYTFAIVFLLLLIVFHNFLITSRIFSSCGEVLPRKRKQTMSLHFVTLSNPVSNCR